MKRWMPFATVAVALAGCRMGPDYRRPDVPVPSAYRDAMGAATAESVADLPWWAVFQDPALEALLHDAAANNYDLAIAAARVEEARAFVGVVSADRYPSVDYQLLGSRDQASRLLQPQGERRTTTYQASIGASWEVDLWGRIRRGEEAALADYFASEEGRRAVMVLLVGDVAQAYFELRALDLALEITLRTVETRQKTLDLFTKRLEGGVSSKLEVARAAGDLAATQADVPLVRQAVAQKENQISLLVGRNPGPVARGLVLGTQTLPPQVPSGIPSALLERRPDVMAAEDQLRAANARIGVAQAAFFPTLSLTGLLGLQSRDLADLVEGRAVAWSLGAGLLGPIFEGGRLKANERIAVAQWEGAKAGYLKAAQSAFRDVADALVAVQRSREVRAEQEKQVKARQEALQLAWTRFDGGLASYFEVLDSQRELFPAEIQLSAAKRDELLAVVALYRALGGGWKGLLDVPCKECQPLPRPTRGWPACPPPPAPSGPSAPPIPAAAAPAGSVPPQPSAPAVPAGPGPTAPAAPPAPTPPASPPATPPATPPAPAPTQPK